MGFLSFITKCARYFSSYSDDLPDMHLLYQCQHGFTNVYLKLWTFTLFLLKPLLIHSVGFCVPLACLPIGLFTILCGVEGIPFSLSELTLAMRQHSKE